MSFVSLSDVKVKASRGAGEAVTHHGNASRPFPRPQIHREKELLMYRLLLCSITANLAISKTAAYRRHWGGVGQREPAHK